MMQNNKEKLKRNKNGLPAQAGVSLIITLFIMIIILSVVLSISALLYSEIKVIRNIGNSVIGLYAADSGIEKVLYYDWNVRPTITNGKKAERGLCSMYDISNNYNTACKSDPNSTSPTEHSIYCQPNNGFESPQPGDNNPTIGCNPEVCDDCTISFSSVINAGDTNSSDDDISYSTEARVYSAGDVDKFEISSKGFYGGAGRQIQIVIETKNIEPTISNFQIDCGGDNTVSADVYDKDGVNTVKMYIVDSETSELTLKSLGDGNYSKPWSNMDNNTSYWVYLIATDNGGNENKSDIAEFYCSN
ncbi:MAG: hypothetical protein WC711_02485 [Candidatus Staskawiczbacteria bacterium]|jgi:hypothetical protein